MLHNRRSSVRCFTEFTLRLFTSLRVTTEGFSMTKKRHSERERRISFFSMSLCLFRLYYFGPNTLENPPASGHLCQQSPESFHRLAHMKMLLGSPDIGGDIGHNSRSQIPF